MSADGERSDTILVAVQRAGAFVRVRGRGSFRNAPALKRFGLGAIEKGCRCIMLDMADCTGMDSTFMGVLAGLALRLHHVPGGGRMAAVNLTGKNHSLLDTLGLTRLMDVYQAGADVTEAYACVGDGIPLSDLQVPEESRGTLAQTMLGAHQDLASLTADNLNRFKDVVAYLDQDLKKIEG